ncbi:hypothetical protein Emag_004852 [Eimeria magna]
MRAPPNEAAARHQRPHLLVIERRRSSSRSSSSCSYKGGSYCQCTGPCLQRCSHSALPATACPFFSSRRPRTPAETAAGSTAAATTGAATAATAGNAATAPAVVAAPLQSRGASISSCARYHIGLSAAHTRKEPLVIPCLPHAPGEASGARVHHNPSEGFFGLQQRESQGAIRCERARSCVTQRTINTQELRRRCSSKSKSGGSLGTREPQPLLQPAQQQQQPQPQQTQQHHRRTSWQPHQPNFLPQPQQLHERGMRTAENEGWSYPDCCSSTQATADRRTSVNAFRCRYPAAATAAAAASGGSASPAAASSCHRNGRVCQQAPSAAAADTEEQCISPLASAGPRGRYSFAHPPDRRCPAAGRPSKCEKESRGARGAAAVVYPAANGLAACHVGSQPSRVHRACEAPVRTDSMSSAREASAPLAVRSSRSSISPAKGLQRRPYSSDAVNVNPGPVLSQQRGSGQQALQQRQRHQQHQRHKQHLAAVQQNEEQRHHQQQPQQQQKAIEPCIDIEYSLFGQTSGSNNTSCLALQEHQQFVVLERLQVHRHHRSHQHMTGPKETGVESMVKASRRAAAFPCAAGLAVRPEHGAPGRHAAPPAVGVDATAKLGIAASAAAATTEIGLKGPRIFSENSAIPKACSSDGRHHSGQAQQQQLGKKQHLLPQLQRHQLYASAVLERLFRVLERSACRRPWMMLLCHAAQRPVEHQQHSKEQEKPLADQASTELEGLSTTEEVSSIDTCMRLEVYRRRLQHQQQRRKQQQQRQKEQQKQHKQQRQQLSQQLAAAAHELKKANDQQEILQERLAAALTRLKHLEQQQQQHRGPH